MNIQETIKNGKTRYIILDDNNKLIDDAQGYGFKTKQAAYKCYAYKFKGGKEKDDRHKNQVKKIVSIAKHKDKFKELEEVIDTFEYELFYAIKDCGGDDEYYKELEQEAFDDTAKSLHTLLELPSDYFENLDLDVDKVLEKLLNTDYLRNKNETN